MGVSFQITALLSLISAISCLHFVKPPSNVEYRRGTDTTGYVVCEIHPPSLRVIWNIHTRSKPNPDVIYASPDFFDEKLKAKYSVNADAGVTGDYTLVIHDLDRDDSGRYTCQVAGIGSKTANVTVADPPGVPNIVLPTGTLRENRTVAFSCSSEGGFPTPTFTWLLGDTQIPNSAHPVIETAGVASSQLRVMLSHEHHMASLSCVATNILNSSKSSAILDVQYSPRITVSPRNLVVLKGRPFPLTCQVDANPTPLMEQWVTGNGELTSRDLFAKGVYVDTQLKCRAENSLGVGEGISQITVHYPPVVSIDQRDPVNVVESNETRIVCNVDSKPVASISWYKGDQLVVQGAELDIASVTKQHAGRYRCEATNTPSPSDGTGAPASAQAEININVQYGPESPTFEVNPSISSGEYRAGVRVSLACSMIDAGNPRGIMKWYKANYSTPLDVVGPSLVIESPQVTDSGIYWCQAENAISSVESERLTLNFMDIPELVKVIDSRKELNASVGLENYQIQCVYRGFPAPYIQWYKGDMPIHNDTKLYTIEHHSIVDTAPSRKVTSTLKFVGSNRKGLIIDDFSKYSCVAFNTVGESVENYEVQLNVMFTPVFAGFGKEAVDEGSDIDIDCVVLSYPPVSSIKFLRHGNLIQSTPNKFSLGSVEFNVENNVYRQKRLLTVRSVSADDYGAYTCEAVNIDGQDSTEIEVVRTSVPDSPTELMYTNVTWHTVNLSWTTAFDGGYPQSFTVHEITNEKHEPVEEINNSHYTVTGLSPMREYKFKVYATNKLGQSAFPYSEIALFTPSLFIPLSSLTFDRDSMTVKVNVTTTGYCTKLEGSVDDSRYVDVLEKCLSHSKDISVKTFPYTSYRVVTCVANRPDICSESPSVAAQVEPKSDQKVIIGVAVSIFLVLVIIVVVIAVIILRKKRRNRKPSADGTKSGHINPIMTPNGVPGKVHYSTHNDYNINSDIEMEDEMDGLPYGEFRNQRESPSPTQRLENLDYVYASVQKKSSEQNKLNDAANTAFQHKPPQPNNLNIHDPLSVSDNSEVGGYDEQPPSPYRSPKDLAFLGDGVMAFHRYPSVSESGYSTPDSKQLKKVVYEVIV